MNQKTKIYLLIYFTVFLTSCTKRSELKHEHGIVVEKQYESDTRQTVVGHGMSSKGGIVTTFHSVGDSEKYIVIFKCDHGVVFSINRNDLYYRLDKGDTVDISYYDIVKRNGELKDLEFVNATKINEWK